MNDLRISLVQGATRWHDPAGNRAYYGDLIAPLHGTTDLILLPETTVEAAARTMTRLQRELTRHFFLHDNEKLLITFSAGVALRHPNEEQTALVQRADSAMYQAKQSGKNRVVVAP